MAYEKNVVESVRQDFEKKRINAQALLEQHQKEVYAKCSLIEDIDKVLSMTGINVYRAAITSGENLDTAIEKLKKENLELQKQKRELLLMNGYPEDYLQIKYECENCKDEGYVGINMCDCFRKELVRRSYETSGLGKDLSKQTFSSFKLTYYSDKKDENGQSPREHMKGIVDKAKKYVSDFGKQGKESNLLFVGASGLGKTHITSAIAKEIIDKGYSVVYDSAQNIVSAFEMGRFEKDETASGRAQRFFDCDLLIIDDLGTEFINSFTQSCLYNLVNTRINTGKPMIISTNLDNMTKFKKTYDDRITSRLVGCFRMFQFKGNDIRILKTKEAQKKSSGEADGN